MAEAPRTGRGSYLPASFAERGVAVPFTTPVLAFARMRETPSGEPQFLVPGLAGGAETYAIPMNNLGETIGLTVFDRTLLEGLGSLESLRPLAIRGLYLKAATSGLAGPVHARAAREALAADAANRDALRARLAERASASGVPVDEVEAAIGEWADLTVPVGSPAARIDGPLLRTMRDLGELSEELRRWLAPEPVGPAEQAQRSGVVADRAAADARKLADFVDSLASDIAQPLSNWADTRRMIAESVERMSYVLDGWRRIAERWNDARRGDRVDQREAVAMFAMYMPVMPVEAAGADAAFWEDVREAQQRWQKAASFQTWMDVDEALRERLQKFALDEP